MFFPLLLHHSFTTYVQFITRCSDLEGKTNHAFFSISFDRSAAITVESNKADRIQNVDLISLGSVSLKADRGPKNSSFHLTSG